MIDVQKRAEIDLCPFCGDWGAEVDESAVPSIHGGQKQAVYCNTCFCEGPTSETEEGAIVAWNRRADAVEAIKAALLAGGAVNLLDQQHSGLVTAQVLDVVPPTALRADEAGSVGIVGQDDQSVGNVELAEVAPGHEVGVPAGSDSGMTASMTPTEGYVPGRAMLRVATSLREKASRSSRPLERKTLIASAEAVEKAVSAARPEVSP